MNNLVIILSHCDTLEKVDTLKKQIKLIKGLGLDTLLCSHIPLEVSIQQSVTYYIYDSDNPALRWPESAISCWVKPMSSTGVDVRLNWAASDYGWTVLDQTKKACNFALTLGYEFYSFINYDVMLTAELENYLLTASALNHPAVCTYSAHFSPTTLFTILKKDVCEKISHCINKADYLKYRCAESHWGALLSPYSSHTAPSPVNDTMSVSVTKGNQNHFNDKFQVFFQNGNMIGEMSEEPQLTKAYFFHIKKNVSIQIQCNDKHYLIKKDSIIDLPANVTKLGFWKLRVLGFKVGYCDFLPEFDKARLEHHCISDHESIPKHE